MLFLWQSNLAFRIFVVSHLHIYDFKGSAHNNVSLAIQFDFLGIQYQVSQFSSCFSSKYITPHTRKWSEILTKIAPNLYYPWLLCSSLSLSPLRYTRHLHCFLSSFSKDFELWFVVEPSFQGRTWVKYSSPNRRCLGRYVPSIEAFS